MVRLNHLRATTNAQDLGLLLFSEAKIEWDTTSTFLLQVEFQPHREREHSAELGTPATMFHAQREI